MAKKTVSQKSKNSDLEKIYQQVLTCEPVIPEEDVGRLADLIKSNEFFGRAWRMTAVLAGKDECGHRI